MAILVGGQVANNKNLWLLNDDLTINTSRLLDAVAEVMGVAIDKDGGLYAACSQSTLYKLDSNLANDSSWNSGSAQNVVGSSAFPIIDIRVDADNKVVAISKVNGDDVGLCNADGSIAWQVSMTVASTPTGCAFKGDGDIYIAHPDNSGMLTSLARADGGETGPTADVGSPSGFQVAVDTQNFSDTLIVMLSVQSGPVRKLTGFFESDLTTAVFNQTITVYPGKVAFDSSGNIFVVGSRASSVSVEKWTFNGTNAVTLSATYDTGANTHGLSIDSDDNVLVSGDRATDPGESVIYSVWKLTNALIFSAGIDVAGVAGRMRDIAAGSDYVSPSTNVPSAAKYAKKLIAIANGELWYESSAGIMEELSAANGDITTDGGRLMAFEGFQKVMIANGSAFKVADFVNTRLTSEAQITTNIPSHGDVLTQDSTGASMVVDYIYYDDVASDHYVFGTDLSTGTWGTSNNVVDSSSNVIITSGNLSAVSTGPFWYDWQIYNENETTYGTMPTDASLACLYRGRAVLAGDRYYPQQWYMSRQGNFWDWAYTATDALSPVKGGNADAGEIGDVITALIPYKDDYLIFGCATSMWFLRGDPMDGGTLNELDLTVGIFGPRSWCFDGEGNLYFWGTNGIYKTTIPGTPECITQIRLPNLIADEDADSSTHRITMGYDRKRVGILICITKMSDGTNSNYFFDLRSGGFFPESYPVECGVYTSFYYAATNEDYRELLFGCRDGYIRKFDNSAKSDDRGDTDAAINSYVNFGPVPLSNDPSKEGKFTSPDLITAGGGASGSQSDSDDVAFKMFTARSAEKLLELLFANGNPKLGGTFKAPGKRISNKRSQKIRGTYLGIRLENTTLDKSWGFEKFIGKVLPSGRQK